MGSARSRVRVRMARVVGLWTLQAWLLRHVEGASFGSNVLSKYLLCLLTLLGPLVVSSLVIPFGFEISWQPQVDWRSPLPCSSLLLRSQASEDPIGHCWKVVGRSAQ